MTEKTLIIDHNKKTYFLNNFRRLYIGSEFCQHLLPNLKEFKQILNLTKHKKISFITPLVNEFGLEKIDKCLNYLSKNRKDSFEVIINDFGVLNLVHNKYPKVEPVLGRIISQQYINLNTSCDIKNISALIDLKNKYNIKRIEIDSRGENTRIEVPQELSGLKFSIYYPFVFISTTRRCVFPHLLSNTNEKYEDYHCNKECLKVRHSFSMSYPMIKDKIYLYKNSHFIKKQKMPKGLKKMNIDRIVYDNMYGKK